MAEDESVGSASVSIVPNTDGWADKVRAQLDPQAAELGASIGKLMADAISAELAKTTGMPVGPDVPSSTRQGQQSGGAFADSFRARVTAALKAIPPVEIGAATSEAEQKIRDIQVELAELSRQTVGIDLSDDEAVAKLDDLRARLADINGSAESVQVKADTAEAIAQLDRFKAELDEMRTEDVNVKVKADDDGSIGAAQAKVAALGDTAGDSGGGFNLLGSQIVNIGAIAAVAADVAIPAILAIGAAAAGAIGGIAVLGLGFSGISDALSAADQKPTGGSGGGDSSSANDALSAQTAAIDAQQQELSAKEATASAAQQLSSALEDQQSAEVSLTKAQRDATDAQTALSQARVQALQDMQDLNNSVTDNALAQRQAALTLAQAKDTLTLTLAAPGAGLPQYQDQVQSAQLAYDQAKQSLSELQLQGTRLTGQQSTSNAQGVNGAPGVVSAQEQLADANQSVTDAQQNLADSTAKVAQAQQNVTDTAIKNTLATEAQALATQKAANSLAGATAGTDAFADAMAKLNPLQQQFVNFLLSLKPLFDEVKDAASGFLPGLEQGIKDALPLFQPLLTLVGNVASALGSVFTGLGQALGSADGQKFVTFLSTELPKQILFLGGLFEDFGKIFSGVFQAAGPLIDATDGAITDFFDSVAKTSNGSGLSSFFDSLIPLVGPIEQLFKSVGGALGSILEALVPVEGPLLGFLTSLIGEIGKIAGPVLTPLAKGFGDLLAALTPLLPVLGGLIETILPPLINLLDAIIKEGIAPLALAIAQALLPVLPQLAGLLDNLVTAIAPLIPQFIDSLLPVLPMIVSSFINLSEAVIPLLPDIVELLVGVTPLVPMFVDFCNSVSPLVYDLLPVLKPLLDGLVAVLPKLIEPLTAVFNGFDKFNSAVVGLVNDIINDVPKIYDTVKTWFDKVVSYIGGVPGKIGGLAKSFASAGAGLITSLFDGIKAALSASASFAEDVGKAVYNAIAGFLDTNLIDKIKDLKFTIGLGPVSHTFQPFNSLPDIPQMRAAGGMVAAGTPYTVGEFGKELFVPTVPGYIMDNAHTEKMMGGSGNHSTTVSIYGLNDPTVVGQQVVSKLAMAAV